MNGKDILWHGPSFVVGLAAGGAQFGDLSWWWVVGAVALLVISLFGPRWVARWR